MNTVQPLAPPPHPREPVHCPNCKHRIWTGTVIRARVVNVVEGTAKCRRCNTWVEVPVKLAESA